MLSPSQKAHLLKKAGTPVPPFPARRIPVEERFLRPGAKIPKEQRDADTEQRAAVAVWSQQVEALYAAHLARRSATCLAQAAPEPP